MCRLGVYEVPRSEFHYSGLCFCHASRRDFSFTPWLPQRWTCQMCYLVYRWSIMLYFLFWLAVTISHAVESIQFKYLIFLTHWGFIAWNSYLVFSTMAVTLALSRDKWQSQHSRTGQQIPNIDDRAELGCCGAYYDGISELDDIIHDCECCRDGKTSTDASTINHWKELDCCKEENSLVTTTSGYQSDSVPVQSKNKPRPGRCRKSTPVKVLHKIQWVLFLIGGEYAVVITILYWVFFTDHNCGGHEQNLYSIDSLHLHMINGIFAVVELWVSGIPVRLYHALYSIGFGCVYVLFTAVYYAAGGKDPEGNRFIYPFLDYGSCPMAAVGLAVSCSVLFVGAVHFVFFLQYIVRKHITGWILQQPQHQPAVCGKGSSLKT